MEVVKDTTQHLRANISQERLGKARLDFGNAGEVLGETAAFVYNQNRQAQQQEQSVPQFQFDTALPELQQAPKVDARKDQRDLEDLVRAKNNGAITDAQFQKSVTDIQDRMYYSGNFTPNEIKSLLNEVPGYSDMAKEINTGYFTAERQGANEAIKEERKKETAKDIEIAQTVVGVDTNLPMEKQAEIGHRYRQSQEFVSLSPAQIKEHSVGDPYLEVAYQRSQTVSLVEILDTTANSIYRGGIANGASPQEIYRAIHEGLFATVKQYGKNPMVVQDLVEAVAAPYKSYSEGDLTAQKQINENLEESKKGKALRQYIVADNLSGGALTTAYNMRALGFDQSLEGLDKMKEMSQYLQTAHDLGQFPAMSNEATQQLLLSYTRNGDKAAVDENVDLAIVRKTTDETSKQTSRTNIETVAKSDHEYLKVVNTALLKDLARYGKVRDEMREPAKQTLANVLQAAVAAYRPLLTKDFSLGVDATGNIIVLKDGQEDSPTFIGRWFETDSAEAEALVKKLRDTVSLVPALNLSRQELQGILPEIKGTAPTTGETIEAVGNSVVLPALNAVNTELQSVGKQIGKTAAADVRDVLKGVSEAGNYIADAFESFLNMLGRDRLSPEEREAVEDLSRRLFQSDEVKEYTATSVIGGDELMYAELKKPETPIATGGSLPKGAVATGERKAIDLNGIKRDLTATRGAVEKAAGDIKAGKKQTTINVKVYDKDGNISRQAITVPTSLALIVDGESFQPSKRGSTVGFGMQTGNISKEWLKDNKIQLQDVPDEGYTNVITVPQAIKLSEDYIKKWVDPKIKTLLPKGKTIENIDPIRLMLARDVLYAYGHSSILFQGYRNVGIKKYIEYLLDESKTVDEIKKYLPLFPPFKARKGIGGNIGKFPSPYGSDRIAMIVNYLDHIKVEKKGKGGK